MKDRHTLPVLLLVFVRGWLTSEYSMNHQGQADRHNIGIPRHSRTNGRCVSLRDSIHVSV